MIELLFSFVIFTAGCVYTWIRWGVQRSISITFYEHTNTALWWLWMILFSFPVMIAAPHWLMFISILGTSLVGAYPDYKKSKEDEFLHNTGAILSIVSSFAYQGLVLGQWIIVGAMAAFFGYARWKLNNSTTWIEVAAFLLTLLGIALSLLGITLNNFNL
jgi:hypothetical protein